MAGIRLLLALTISALAVSAQAIAQMQPIKIDVDASEATRRLVRATLQFPVTSGPFTLLYPKWIPGEHSPTGPIEDLAGMKVSANGQAIPWARDLVDMYQFHIQVPQGVSTLTVSVEFISPPDSAGFSSGGSITSQLAMLSWNQLLLYPQGTPTDQLRYQATLKVPAGWRYGTALPIQSESVNEIVLKPSSLTTLVDSPVQTRAHYKTVDLGLDGGARHYLHIAADSEGATRIPDSEVQHYRNLVLEANALFGGHHYRDYHLLYTLSDHVAHFGLEHHESSDDRMDEDAVVDEDHRRLAAGLLPHEMVHSWNGKFRRPAGLATADYSQPMTGELLWVYEGLTEYLGEILTPRSGLSTAQDFLDTLAGQAARLDNETGRAWRPLADTAVAAQFLYNARDDYADFRRDVDFYDEGTLIWLDADVTIRALSGGKKSLDDFCKLWAGAPNTAPEVKPYTFDDVVRTLNAVQPNDWAGFLNQRLQSTSAHAPLNGITGAGYKLVYTAERSSYQKNYEETRRKVSEAYSIGITANEDGQIVDGRVDSPAYKAGIAPATKIVAVNEREFNPKRLGQAVADSATSSDPITLLVKDGEYYKTWRIDYHSGEKFPHLVRDESKPDVMADIIRAHAAPRSEIK
jgi:predicted metalloprotease with PDZ domain